MTGTQFILYVKAKLNRLDSSSYEDVRKEEVLFFGNEALKKLILDLDLGIYSRNVNKEVVQIYLSSINKSTAEIPITGNTYTITNVLKLKDVSVFVTVGTETGWMPTRDVSNVDTTGRESNPFMKSYPDKPSYRLIDGGLYFDVDNTFSISKIKYNYLLFPSDIVETSTITYPFLSELEDVTVSLLLENLESRRISTQPVISKS